MGEVRRRRRALIIQFFLASQSVLSWQTRNYVFPGHDMMGGFIANYMGGGGVTKAR